MFSFKCVFGHKTAQVRDGKYIAYDYCERCFKILWVKP